MRDVDLANPANSANLTNFEVLLAMREGCSAKFEVELLDFQGLDPGLKS